MSDLSNFEVVEEAKPMTLVNPVSGEDLLNDEKPQLIYLFGLHSKVVKTASREIKARDRSDKKLSESEADKRTLDLMARATARFENVLLDGEIIDYSHQQASDLYSRFPWIKKQVMEFVGVEANHLGNSQKG